MQYIRCYPQVKRSAVSTSEKPLPLTSAGVWKVADCCTCGSPNSKTTYHLHLARRKGWARVLLDLSEGEFVRPPHFFDLQLEGVFIGVMLHNVVVHVHQNPERGESDALSSTRSRVGPRFPLALLPTSCDPGRKILKLPKPQFPHLRNGDG